MKRPVLPTVVSVSLTVFLAGCSYVVDKDEIVAWVKQSVTEKCRTNPDWIGLEVTSVALVRETSSRFTGYVEFRWGSETERADLVVTVDSTTRIYTCEPPRALIAKRQGTVYTTY